MNMTGDKWISVVKLVTSVLKALGFIPRTRNRKNEMKKILSRKLDIHMPEDDI